MSSVPPPYDRQSTFVGVSVETTPDLGSRLEAEFNKLDQVLDATQSRLDEIQRDDGKLENESVHPESLSRAVRSILVTRNGDIKGEWEPVTDYVVGDVVQGTDGLTYIAAADHTSNADFAVDVAAVRWLPVSGGGSGGGGGPVTIGDVTGLQTALDSKAPTDAFFAMASADGDIPNGAVVVGGAGIAVSLVTSPGANQLVVAQSPTGVTAGTYNNATITVDAQGRIMAASTGMGAGNIDGSQVVSGIVAPERLGLDIGSIPTGSEPNYVLNAAGRYVALQALFDGSIIATGGAPNSGGSAVFDGLSIGTGTAAVFKDKSSSTLRFRSLKAGANITITENADDITITSAGGGGGLPAGGTIRQVLRGDGLWSNSIRMFNAPSPSASTFDFTGGFLRVDAFDSPSATTFAYGFEVYNSDQPGNYSRITPGTVELTGGMSFGVSSAAKRTDFSFTTESGPGGSLQNAIKIGNPFNPSSFIQFNLVTGSVAIGGASPILSVGIGGTGSLNANVDASKIASGQLATARLAAGTASEGFVPKVVSGVVTWAADATGGGGISDGNKGDITVSGSGSSWQINANAVSTTEIADQGVTAAKLNRAGGGTPSSSVYYRGDNQWRNFFADSNTWSAQQRFLTSATNVSTDSRFTSASNSEASFRMDRSCRPANDRSGSGYLLTLRDGGSPQNNFFIEYNVTAPLSSGFDIALTALATYTNLQGGAATGAWLCAFSPSGALGQTWTSGSVFAAEINYGNRWADIGLCEDRLQPRWVAGLQVVPDVVLTFDGADPNTQYNAQFGIVFAASGAGAKTHIPFFIEQNATAPNGYAMKVVGGSNSANKAAFLLKAGGHFNQGIDFSSVTFADTENRAIILSGSQAIEFGGGRIWYDPATQKMKVYDPIGGTRDL